MNNIYKILILVLLLICAKTFAADTTSTQINSAKEAIQLTLKYSGFKINPDSFLTEGESKVSVVIVVDTTTPFLADSINGKRAWLVPIDNVVLDCKRTIKKVAIENPKKLQSSD